MQPTICKSKFRQNRKKSFRHSTTFYRKLKAMVNDNKDHSVKQHDVLNQLPAASSSVTSNIVQQEQVVRKLIYKYILIDNKIIYIF